MWLLSSLTNSSKNAQSVASIDITKNEKYWSKGKPNGWLLTWTPLTLVNDQEYNRPKASGANNLKYTMKVNKLTHHFLNIN